MVNLSEINADLKLEFPCEWEYKVFLDLGQDAGEFFAANNLAPKRLSAGKKNAKYACYNAVFAVQNNAERLELFSLLKKQAKFVL